MTSPITTAEMQKIKDVIKALESDDTIMKLHGHDDFAHAVNPRFVLRLIETIEEQQKVIGFYADGSGGRNIGDIEDIKLDDGKVISVFGKRAREWMGRVG